MSLTCPLQNKVSHVFLPFPPLQIVLKPPLFSFVLACSSSAARRRPSCSFIYIVHYLHARISSWVPCTSGANGKASNLANMATAITALYGMGYTLAEDESSHSEMMEEDRGSDKSSPDIHRHRQLAGAFDPAHQLFRPANSLQTPVPAGSQYAAMLAGIGLNLNAVSAALKLVIIWELQPLLFYGMPMMCSNARPQARPSCHAKA